MMEDGRVRIFNTKHPKITKITVLIFLVFLEGLVLKIFNLPSFKWLCRKRMLFR